MKKIKTLVTISVVILTMIFTTAFSFGAAAVNTTTYTHADQFANAMVIDGIDVSYAQGGSIDWAKVKRAGMDYAIIRVGATSYGDGHAIVDDYYRQNIEGAKAAGLMVGVYYYSQAITQFEAQLEANRCLKLIEGYEIDLPVVMDYEYGGGSSGRLSKADLTKTEATNIVNKWCSTIQKAGYEPMVYASLNFLKNQLYVNTVCNKWPVWLAQYNDYSSLDNKFDMWQYTSGGNVFGISGSVDCNFWYFDKDKTTETVIDATTGAITLKSIKSCYGSLGTTSYTYTKYQKKPSVTVRDGATTLVEGTDYKLFYVSNVMAGTGYAFVKGIGKYTDVLLIPFTIKKQDFSGITVTGLDDQEFDGDPVKPTVKVQYKGTSLKKNIDYTISYSNNTAVGRATVTLTAKRNFTGTVTKHFTITKGNPVITTAYSKYTRTTANKYFTLFPKSPSTSKFTYTTSDPNVVTVTDTGRIYIEGAGVATVTVKQAGNSNWNAASKVITVTVNKSTPELTVPADIIEKGYKDEPFKLEVTNPGDGTLSYTSSDTNIAKVSSTGRVTIVGAGTATITVTSSSTKDFNSATKVITLNIVGGPQEITGTKSWNKPYGTKDFSLGLTASGGGTMTYESSDEDVLTVSEEGIVTVVGTGKAKVYVTAAANGPYDKATKTVTIKVRPKKQSIALSLPSAGKFRVTYKTDPLASGYEIKYSTYKSFTKNYLDKNVKVVNSKSRSYKVAYPGKRYYVKVRSYVIAEDGTKIYGTYSGYKSIVVKK